MGAGTDELRLEVRPDGTSQLSGVGCPALLRALALWRPRLTGPPSAWSIPKSDRDGHAEHLLREVVLKAQGRWAMPFADAELCHCRFVPGRDVDLAVLRGAVTPSEVGSATGAGTQCGTCRPDVQSVIDYRFGLS